MHAARIGLVVVLVFLAGCGGLVGDDTIDDETGAGEPTETETAIPEPSATQTATPAGTEAEETTETGTETSTGEDGEIRDRLREIALSASDLSDEYETKGSLVLSREEASGEDAERFDQRELEAVAERTFTLSESSGDDPEIVFTSAMKYRNETAAEDDLDRIQTEFETSGANVSERSVSGSVTATVVAFENDQGYQNVVFYGRTDDVVFYVAASDGESRFEDRAEELFKRMLVRAQ